MRAIASGVLIGINPHCAVWANAKASLWGVAKDHDLDEAVRLSDEVPVRLRYRDGFYRQIIADRELSLKLTRAGTHVAIRFYFSGGTYFESDISGIYSIGALDKTANVDLRS